LIVERVLKLMKKNKLDFKILEKKQNETN